MGFQICLIEADILFRHRNLGILTNKGKASGNICHFGIIEKYVGRIEDTDLLWYVNSLNKSELLVLLNVILLCQTDKTHSMVKTADVNTVPRQVFYLFMYLYLIQMCQFPRKVPP